MPELAVVDGRFRYRSLLHLHGPVWHFSDTVRCLTWVRYAFRGRTWKRMMDRGLCVALGVHRLALRTVPVSPQGSASHAYADAVSGGFRTTFWPSLLSLMFFS